MLTEQEMLVQILEDVLKHNVPPCSVKMGPSETLCSEANDQSRDKHCKLDGLKKKFPRQIDKEKVFQISILSNK